MRHEQHCELWALPDQRQLQGAGPWVKGKGKSRVMVRVRVRIRVRVGSHES